MLVLCFLVVFCLRYCFMFWRFASEIVWKNSLDGRSCVSGIFSLYFRFFVDVSFVCVISRDKAQVVTGHPHTHLFSSVFVLLFCPAALVYRPFLAVRPASWCFLGVPFWAPRVFGILLELTGLELARPFRGPFFGREAAWVFLCFLCLVVIFPLLFCFAASHFLLEGPPTARPTAGPGRSTSRPSPE